MASTADTQMTREFCRDQARQHRRFLVNQGAALPIDLNSGRSACDASD